MRSALILLPAVLLASALAHADSFSLLGQPYSGGTPETGTLTIDTIAGTVTAVSLDAGGVLLDTIISQDEGGDVSFIGLGQGDGSTFAQLRLFGSLVGYTGGSFGQSGPNNLYSGTVSPIPAPEPGTLALLATGTLGAAAVVRRRLA